MPTTSSSSLRYPASSAAPNAPQDFQNLATDLDKKVTPYFASAAARTAAIPSPSVGQTCVISLSANTVHQTYDGSGWRFTLGGSATGTTDSSGLLTFSHGAGVAPRSAVPPVVGMASMLTESQNQIAKVVYFSSTSTTITVKFYRTDTSAAFVSQAGLVCTWICWF